jgi:hypothetical protein
MIVVFEAELQQVAAMLQRLPELLLPAWARAPRRAKVDTKTTLLFIFLCSSALERYANFPWTFSFLKPQY